MQVASYVAGPRFGVSSKPLHSGYPIFTILNIATSVQISPNLNVSMLEFSSFGNEPSIWRYVLTECGKSAADRWLTTVFRAPCKLDVDESSRGFRGVRGVRR